jgi:xeroderma pigmentosum group C-complementing protein
MPPFVPRNTPGKSTKQGLLQALDASPSTASLEELKAFKFPGASDSSSDDASASEDSEHDSEDDVKWEDAIAESTTTPASAATPAPAPVLKDLDLTLEKHSFSNLTDALGGKKGPSKIERHIRIQTHCMHVQFLLFHNSIRNWWINDKTVHQILLDQLPEGIKKEVRKWKIATGLEQRTPPPPPPPPQGSKKRKRDQRDWAAESVHVENTQPDPRGVDPTFQILRVLAAYWKKHFKITAPGLRKRGYRPIAALEEEISSFNKLNGDSRLHGERIADIGEFRELAKARRGSRDVGAQLFTALLRALGMEARLVASLQPLGFGWTKAEIYTPSADKPVEDTPLEESQDSSSDESVIMVDDIKGKSKAVPQNRTTFDSDLPFPTYWTEVASPVTHEIIPVENLVLRNSVASTPDLLAAFEPRGSKAEKAKQVIAYVVAYSPDASAKDVTTRYLKRQTWPGKTKGFRIPVEKVSLSGSRGASEYYTYDWFRRTMRPYARPDNQRTMVDEKEDTEGLAPRQPERKTPKEADTLQSLRTSPEFVLERFLRREEAMRPGAEHVRTFTSGKGPKAKEEKVYRRSDVLRCLSAETWHKEGRRVKAGEKPLKLVPIRAVTLNRQREVEEAHRETGEKPKQGLYAINQTEYIVPPPIKDGVIPKNAYGNIDCFVPSMVPKGAAHIPWPGTVRICKKLGIDYAEAVTGFEFGSKMAVPVIQGVVVAAENEALITEAWIEAEAQKREKDRLKREKQILSTWRKFIMGLRINERIQEEYGDMEERESHNPFVHQPRPKSADQEDSASQEGGGFLVPGQDEEEAGGFLVEERGGRDDSGGGGIDDSSELSDAPSEY